MGRLLRAAPGSSMRNSWPNSATSLRVAGAHIRARTSRRAWLRSRRCFFRNRSQPSTLRMAWLNAMLAQHDLAHVQIAGRTDGVG
jgi:hypothetical protein